VLSLALAFGRAAAEDEAPPKIHECVDADGVVTYQSDECGPTPPRKARPRPQIAPAPPPPPAPAPVPPPKRTPRRVVVPNLAADDEAQVPEEPGPADPRLGSPQQTWKTFLDALRSGDRALATRCLTSSALEENEPVLTSLSVEFLRQRADALPEIVFKGMAGPFRVATAKVRGQRPEWVFFEKNRKGEWRIAAL
jgi:hypothetical protein